MALVRLPEGQQRSGNQGGIVWSRNRYGPYIRTRAIPVNPNTERQIAARNRMNQCNTAWNFVLTEDQREAWRVYCTNTPLPGKFGTEQVLDGKAMYTRINTLRLQAGLDRLDDGPTVFGLPDPESFLSATASEATQQVSVGFSVLNPWRSEDGGAQAFYLGIPKGAHIQYFSSPFRLLGVVLGDSAMPPTSPQLFDSPWPFVAGHKMWLKSRVLRSAGGVSGFSQITFLGAA